MHPVLIASLSTAIIFCCSGCRAIGALASPSPWEIKIPAEYKLADNKPEKMLVLVEQPAWAMSEANMRVYLTQAVESLLTAKIGIKADVFVPYNKLADLRSNTPDFSAMSQPQVGARLGAGLVLYIVIDNFELYAMSDAGYYRGQLDARSGLYDVKSGLRLWPQDDLKSSSVYLDMEDGQEKAAKRLASSTARCIVRNFYDCPKPEYKVPDESVRQF